MSVVQQIALSWAGQAAAVLCGGPSMIEGFNRTPLGVRTISANAHGVQHRRCDYIVAVDRVHTVTKQDMHALLRPYGAPIVSPLFFADYRITDWPHWWNSGFHAIWLAWALGASPIIVCGMDCYTGDTYYHTARYPSSGHDKTPEFFLDAAQSVARHTPGANIRLASPGLLSAVWPTYRASEQFAPFVPSIEQQGLTVVPQLLRVRARETYHLWKNQTFPNHIQTVTESEARDLLARGLVDVVPDPRAARRSRGDRGQGRD